MKNILFSSFLFGIFILLSGFTSNTNSITSYTDADYRTFQFKNILVVTNTNNLSDRLNLENRIVKVFTHFGMKSVISKNSLKKI
jgi:hypothetical protein